MLTLDFAAQNFAAELARFCAAATVPEDISASVRQILGDVRARGDAAVIEYIEKFDRARLAPKKFRVTPAEIAAAVRRLPAAEHTALRAAHRSIVDFNRRGLPQPWQAKNPQGASVGEKFDPIRRVGLYVPGGEVPLVSTVLMTATLARIARCREIVVCTPSNAAGEIADGLLAALALVRVTEVYRVGGVQAIAAMAYGTATIRAVDKIYGPGNAYVCEAKRQVFGTVGVDSLPGPSEVMVIADEHANVEFAAADLLAQAEHGSGREKIYLVATSRAVLDSIAAAVAAQLPQLTRSEKTERVLREGFLGIVVKTLGQAAEVANYVAPEHLELLVRPAAAKRLVRAITTAGAIMVGNDTPTALGDFVAGPSHVLPTARAGRFFSGLRVADFLRRTSVVSYDAKSLRRAEPTVSAFAAMERLDGHGRSVQIRAARR